MVSRLTVSPWEYTKIISNEITPKSLITGAHLTSPTTTHPTAMGIDVNRVVANSTHIHW